MCVVGRRRSNPPWYWHGLGTWPKIVPYIRASQCAFARGAISGVREDAGEPSYLALRCRSGFSDAALGSWLADMLSRLAVRYPEVPVVFAGSRRFAEELAYCFLGAAVADRIEST